jgi:lysine 2,3-aminomutase
LEQQSIERVEEPLSSSFRRLYYPEASEGDWNDWKWQLKNRITTRKELERFIQLNENEIKVFEEYPNIKFSVTPYYARLLQSDAIRKCVVPTIFEKVHSNYENEDPLCEEKTNPVKCIVHKYPDRVLFLTTDFCASKCRYCTRSRIVENDSTFFKRDNWIEAIDYIKDHNEIRDVIISGGDPLTMRNEDIGYLLFELYSIQHVKIIRIGTKVPVVLPQRIDKDLLALLDIFWKKLYVNIHFTHLVELTKETQEACLKLAKLGIPLGSQTVLLQEVNDNTRTMKNLMQNLLQIKVIPRYLYNMDSILGSSHFKVSIEKGKEIIKGIQGYTSGMAVPRYVIDSELGKIPVDIGYSTEFQRGQYLLTNYEGREITYYE